LCGTPQEEEEEGDDDGDEAPGKVEQEGNITKKLSIS
jgi:hypothetical protein